MTASRTSADQILVAPVGFGHAGELRELVDDPAQIVGLADDDIGILVEVGRSLVPDKAGGTCA